MCSTPKQPVHFFCSDNDALEGVKLMHGTFSSQKFKPHFHECYTIIVVCKGIGDYLNGNKDFMLSEGSILVLNPYDVHAGQAVNETPWAFLTIYIPVHIVQYIGLSFKKGTFPIFDKKRIDDFQLFLKATKVFEGLACKQNATSLLQEFLKEIVSRYATRLVAYPNKPNPVMQNIREYIHENYQTEIPITQLCRLAQVSDFKLIKQFRNTYHLPPHQYQVNLRIEKARELISTTNKSLTEIAFEVGFFDQSHFIRHFKKIVGVTPKIFSSPFRIS